MCDRNHKLIAFCVLIFISLFSTLTLEANEVCWIVSGAENDSVGAFSKTKVLLECEEKTIINGVECKCFKCWKGCAESIENATKNSEGDFSKVTILQGAHGSPGGGAFCNKAHNTSDEILDLVEQISTKAQVGLIAHSCYSGDLISRKLIRESQNRSSSAIKNSCIVTASTMGKVEYAHRDDLITQALKQTSEVSLHDLFKNSFNYGGLISSAQWSTIYLDQYLTNLEAISLASAITTVEKLNEFVSSKSVLKCINDQELNCMFISPNQQIIHEWSKEGADLPNDIIKSITLLSLNLGKKFHYIFDDGELVQRKRNKFEMIFIQKCRQYFESFDGKDMWSFCGELKMKNEEFKSWYNRNPKKSMDNPLQYCLEELYTDKSEKDFSTYWYLRNNMAMCPELENRYSELKTVIKNEDLLKILLDDKMKSEEKALRVLRSYNSSNIKPYDDKNAGKNILLQILGKELDISEEGEGDFNRISDATSAHLLESWVRHNLSNPISPADSLDKLRKKACEDFKIKVTPVEQQ